MKEPICCQFPHSRFKFRKKSTIIFGDNCRFFFSNDPPTPPQVPGSLTSSSAKEKSDRISYDFLVTFYIGILKKTCIFNVFSCFFQMFQCEISPKKYKKSIFLRFSEFWLLEVVSSVLCQKISSVARWEPCRLCRTLFLTL